MSLWDFSIFVLLLVVVSWQAGSIVAYKKALRAFRETHFRMIETNDLVIKAMEDHMRAVEISGPKDRRELS